MAYFELLRELDMEFGIQLVTETRQHVAQRVAGCRTLVGVPPEAPCMIHDEQAIKEYFHRLESRISGAPGRPDTDETGFDSWIDIKCPVRSWADHVAPAEFAPIHSQTFHVMMFRSCTPKSITPQGWFI
jgi:hypothetical protein